MNNKQTIILIMSILLLAAIGLGIYAYIPNHQPIMIHSIKTCVEQGPCDLKSLADQARGTQVQTETPDASR